MVRVYRALQRIGIARVHHTATHGLKVCAQRQQIGMALLGVKQADVRRRDAGHAQLLGGGHHFGHAVKHTLAFLIDQQAIELYGFLSSCLLKQVTVTFKVSPMRTGRLKCRFCSR